MMAVDVIWRCRQCGQALGVISGDRVVIIHQGREIIAQGAVEQRCHRCGEPNRWPEMHLDI